MMPQRTLRNLTVMGMVAAMLIGSTTLASAKIVERDDWSFSDTFTDEDCGLPVEIQAEASGRLMLRQDKKDSPAFLLSNVFDYREVITNLDNGRWMVIRGRVNFRDVTATQVEGDVYRFRAQVAGQHFVIENSDGEVVYRDRGLLVFDVLFDTLGDDVPGGEELSFELVAMRGHPGYIEDLCPVIHDLIG